jgi:hypothetical protein
MSVVRMVHMVHMAHMVDVVDGVDMVHMVVYVCRIGMSIISQLNGKMEINHPHHQVMNK